MNFFKLLPLITVLSLTSAKAATFYVSNLVDLNTDVLFQETGATNAPLLNGGIVAIGYFSSNAYVPSSSLAVIGTTISDFTIVTSALTGSASAQLSVAGQAGYVDAAGFSVGTITNVSPLFGRTIYVFVGNQSTLGASTAFALQAVGVIADDTPVPGGNEYFTRPSSTIPVPVIGQINTNAYTGEPFPSGGAGVQSFDTLQLIAIPEPSTLLLASLGVLGLLRRRR
jgi:hypothetical protein